MREQLTSQTEEFLEAVYRLQQSCRLARTTELVSMLGVVPGTVTNTVERLEKRGLIIHETYKGVRLTETGRKIALGVLRRHRLSERLLTDVLLMEWNEVHDAACLLEHGVTDKVAKNIEKILEWPQTCPHGNPIPTIRGRITEEDTDLLSELMPGDEGIVTRITDEKHDTLQHIEEVGLKPGVCITVLERDSRRNLLAVRINETSRTLSWETASVIRVRNLRRGSQANDSKRYLARRSQISQEQKDGSRAG